MSSNFYGSRPKIWDALDLFVDKMPLPVFHAILPDLIASGGEGSPENGDGHEKTRNRWPTLIVNSFLSAFPPVIPSDPRAIPVSAWPKWHKKAKKETEETEGGQAVGNIKDIWVVPKAATRKSPSLLILQSQWPSHETMAISDVVDNMDPSTKPPTRLHAFAPFVVLRGVEISVGSPRVIRDPWLVDYDAHDPESLLKALQDCGVCILDNDPKTAVWRAHFAPTAHIQPIIEAIQQEMWRKKQGLPLETFGKYTDSWAHLFKLLLFWGVIRQAVNRLRAQR